MLVAQACGIDDAGRAVDAGSDAGRDAPFDGGVVMTQDTGPVCVATPELCNGVDDDCDDEIDEGFDLDSDVLNCGACGRPCPELPHAAPVCSAGVCDLTCDPDFADCDDVQATGCEASLGAGSSCGRCDRTCGAGFPLCRSGWLGIACVGACAAGSVPCSNSCSDLTTDVLHCGGCDMACAQRSHARPSCEGSACGMVCDRAFADCDASEETGCETPCPRAHATVTCEGGSCRVLSCDSGWADCDGLDATGCETQLGTVSDCGSCGDACPVPSHATASCTSIFGCGMTCDAGWDNCDLNFANGCETAIDSPTDCGACGASCGPGETCIEGACT